jgi:hypothetical protein
MPQQETYGLRAPYSEGICLYLCAGNAFPLGKAGIGTRHQQGARTLPVSMAYRTRDTVPARCFLVPKLRLDFFAP